MELMHYYQTQGQDRQKIVQLLHKHFSNPEFAFSEDDWEHMRGCEFMKAMGYFDNGNPLSWASALITTHTACQQLQQGKLTEETLPAYDPRSGESSADLFWLSLVFEDKKHAPYLVRNLFKEIESSCRKWKINIKNVYAIAYTQLSRRLMLRYKFKEIGLYQSQYAIMHAPVDDNPYLKAVIPYINQNTNKPW